MAISSKVRKHSGRKTPLLVKGMKKEELIEQGIEPLEHWDDWKDYRDGQRGSNDRKQLRSPHMRAAQYFDVERWNVRLKKLIARRRARKRKKLGI